MRLNLNETVKVKLTERGKKIYREHFSHHLFKDWEGYVPKVIRK